MERLLQFYSTFYKVLLLAEIRVLGVTCLYCMMHRRYLRRVLNSVEDELMILFVNKTRRVAVEVRRVAVEIECLLENKIGGVAG